MTKFALAMWITVSAMAGCAVDAPQASDPTVDEAATTESTATEELSIEPPFAEPRFSCSARNATCLTAFQCHHQEGTNIGVAGCRSGTTCCVF
jgi:hypothetical protein